MSSSNVFFFFFYRESFYFYTVPQGATDRFSDFVGFIMSFPWLCGPFGQLLCTSWNWKFDYNTMLLYPRTK